MIDLLQTSWHGIILHSSADGHRSGSVCKQNFGTASYCIICRRSPTETPAFSTARPSYSLIASISVNSLPALQPDSKRKNQTTSPMHSMTSASGAALPTSTNNFASASDRSGSNAASMASNNFASASDHFGIECSSPGKSDNFANASDHFGVGCSSPDNQTISPMHLTVRGRVQHLWHQKIANAFDGISIRCSPDYFIKSAISTSAKITPLATSAKGHFRDKTANQRLSKWSFQTVIPCTSNESN